MSLEKFAATRNGGAPRKPCPVCTAPPKLRKEVEDGLKKFSRSTVTMYLRQQGIDASVHTVTRHVIEH